MFRAVDVVLLNKIDLVPYLDVDVDSYIARVREVNPTATILPVSARTGPAWPPGSAGCDGSWQAQRPESTVCHSASARHGRG